MNLVLVCENLQPVCIPISHENISHYSGTSIMDTVGTSEIVLYMEVCLIQRLSSTVIQYCEMRTNVLNRAVPFVRSIHKWWLVAWYADFALLCCVCLCITCICVG